MNVQTSTTAQSLEVKLPPGEYVVSNAIITITEEGDVIATARVVHGPCCIGQEVVIRAERVP